MTICERAAFSEKKPPLALSPKKRRKAGQPRCSPSRGHGGLRPVSWTGQPFDLRAGITAQIRLRRDAEQAATATQHEHTSRRYAAGRCHFVCLCMGRGGSAAHPRTNRLRSQPLAARPREALVGSSPSARPPRRGSGGSPEGAATLRYHVGRPLWPSLLLSQG